MNRYIPAVSQTNKLRYLSIASSGKRVYSHMFKNKFISFNNKKKINTDNFSIFNFIITEIFLCHSRESPLFSHVIESKMSL